MTKAVFCFAPEIDKYVNIPADRIEIQTKDGYITAYNGDKLVGVFDMSALTAAYLSSVGGQRNERA